VIELSAKSVQDSDESETDVQPFVDGDTAVHSSAVSACGDHVSSLSGYAPHPNLVMLWIDPTDSTPIIATDMTFIGVPRDPVPSTPVIAWNEMTSADNVPTAPVAALPTAGIRLTEPTESTAPVAAFPETSTALVAVTLPTAKVDALPVTALVDVASTEPTAQVDALPEMAMETVSPTVPTLPVAIFPFS
jgi:hypothetical protein